MLADGCCYRVVDITPNPVSSYSADEFVRADQLMKRKLMKGGLILKIGFFVVFSGISPTAWEASEDAT
jgi:hypothetical protein